MKHNRCFEDFLKNEVNLNDTRLNSLNDKVRAVSEFLSQNLDSFEKDRTTRFICATHDYQTGPGWARIRR